MKKLRILSLALAGALCLSMLSGCGNGDQGSANTPGSGETTPAGTENGSTGSTEGTIKIGGIGPLTGSAAVYGLATKQGAEAACSSPWTSRTMRATPRRLSTPTTSSSATARRSSTAAPPQTPAWLWLPRPTPPATSS